MHDQLRDLGREIVREENFDEPWKRSRIWSQEEALDVLKTNVGKGKVEGLNIDFKDISRSQCLENEGFAEMNKLRLLRVDDAIFAKNFTHPFSQLKWLSWMGSPMQFTLRNFDPRKLVVLNLSYSEITEDWLGWKHIKVAENLKVLDLTSCKQLSRTPDLSENRLLEILILAGCYRLIHIDESVGLLKKLRVLDTSGCFQIESSPMVYLSNLTNLEIFSFKTSGTPEEVSSFIEKFTKVRALKFYCRSFSDLPAAISVLTCVESLSLQCLGLRCISILPSSLNSLKITYCHNLTEIPGVNELGSLKTLEVVQCCSLERLPYLSNCKKLKHLRVLACESLIEIPRVDNLDSLEELNISECIWLGTLPDLSNLKKLKTLIAYSCVILSEIPGLNGLEESLEQLDISWCESLVRLPDLSKFKKLKKLKAILDEEHTKILGIHGLKCLEEKRHPEQTLPEEGLFFKMQIRKYKRILDAVESNRKQRKIKEGWWRSLCRQFRESIK
ncbi:disease resistance protein RPV1-like [Macadamia integrifolia]|uniref:disease resistance protein RPV1-like n=1 Tax=Macadamia integrifolia TaxID=60698 RepID=UPI001C4F8CB6|nr:disease resistance protein RPV1-like [Macadamia integrifolia]